MHYDVKAFLRELALTRVYQRSSEPPPARAPATKWRRLPVRRRVPQDAVARATGLERDARARTGRAGACRSRRSSTATTPRCGDLSDGRPAAGTCGDDDRGGGARSVAGTSPRSCSNSPPRPASRKTRPSQRSIRPSSSATATRFRPGWPRQTAAWSGGSPLADAAAIADELYLSLYTRRPTEEERAKWPATSPIAARNAYPRCRSWPGPSWRQPSFDSTISHSRRRPSAAAQARPPGIEEITMRCYLCVRIGGAHHLAAVVSWGATAGLGLASGFSGMISRPSRPSLSAGAASAGDLAARRARASSKPGTPSRAPTPAGRSGRSRPRCPACGSPS